MCMCLACNADWYYWSHDLAWLCVWCSAGPFVCLSVCLSVCLNAPATSAVELNQSRCHLGEQTHVGPIIHLLHGGCTLAPAGQYAGMIAYWRHLANMLEWLHIGTTWPICWNNCTLAPAGQCAGMIAHWRQLANMLERLCRRWWWRRLLLPLL